MNTFAPSAAFTLPFTDSGRASIVARPPWHYAGWLLNVGFDFDPVRGQGIVPAALGRATGSGCIHFADWQACTDGRELRDPVYAQYRETIVILDIERSDGSASRYCPFIYVDQDIALVRGWLQGWPKKLGQTWLARSLPLSHPAAAALVPGTCFGASLSVKERRLLDAEFTVDGSKGEQLGFLAGPTVGAVGWPDLCAPAADTPVRFVRADIRDRVESGWVGGRASLHCHEHPMEELPALGPLQAMRASAGWLGLSVHGAVLA